MTDFDLIMAAYEASGGDPSLLASDDVARLVISGNEVIGANDVPGVSMVAEQLADGVRVALSVAPGARVAQPVHLCFGMLPETGVQRIVSTFEIGTDAEVSFVTHCTFPNAVQVQHLMESTIHVGARASMRYSETHYHGEQGGTDVRPVAAVTVDEGGRYYSIFSLSHGRAGQVDFAYEIDVAANGVAELDARMMGYGDDEVIVRETIRLNGEGARGLAKSRIAVRERARSEVYRHNRGQRAAHARPHRLCRDRARPGHRQRRARGARHRSAGAGHPRGRDRHRRQERARNAALARAFRGARRGRDRERHARRLSREVAGDAVGGHGVDGALWVPGGGLSSGDLPDRGDRLVAARRTGAVPVLWRAHQGRGDCVPLLRSGRGVERIARRGFVHGVRRAHGSGRVIA